MFPRGISPFITEVFDDRESHLAFFLSAESAFLSWKLSDLLRSLRRTVNLASDFWRCHSSAACLVVGKITSFLSALRKFPPPRR